MSSVFDASGFNEMMPRTRLADNNGIRDDITKEQIFQNHPALSMIASVLYDYYRYLNGYSSTVAPDFEMILSRTADHAALYFQSIPLPDGSIPEETANDIQNFIHGVETLAMKYALRHLHVDLDYRLVASRADFTGYVELLDAFEREEGLMIGPQPGRPDKTALGHYHRHEIEAAIAAANQGGTRPVARTLLNEEEAGEDTENDADNSDAENKAAGEVEDMAAQSERFIRQVIQPLFPSDTIFYNFYPANGGFRHSIAPYYNNAGALENVRHFFDRISALALPDGIALNSDDFVIRADTAQNFARFIDCVKDALDLHSRLENGADAAGGNGDAPLDGEADEDLNEELDDEADPPLFWQHPEPVNHLHACSLLMQGLSEHVAGCRAGVHWNVRPERGLTVLEADFDDAPMTILQKRVEKMAQLLKAIADQAGDWHQFSIDITGIKIEFEDIRTFCTAIENYQGAAKIILGKDALNNVMAPGDDASLLEQAWKKICADPTLAACLPQQAYLDANSLSRDMLRLDAARETGLYGGPIDTAHVMRLWKDDEIKHRRAPDLQRWNPQAQKPN